jgi:hypothetical protein
LIGQFSPIVPPLANRGLSRRLMWSASGDEGGTKAGMYNKPWYAAVYSVGNHLPHTEDEDEDEPRPMTAQQTDPVIPTQCT